MLISIEWHKNISVQLWHASSNMQIHKSTVAEFKSLVIDTKSNTPGWGGGTQMARGGIRLVHGHIKSTLITYFSCMKVDPKYAFLHAFFLICLSCPFQNLSI